MLVEPRSATDAPAPDGDYVAWVQCATCNVQAHFLYSSCLGASELICTALFKISLLKPLETDYPSWTPSQISWIGSIQAFFLFGFSIVAGPVFDRGYLRSLVWIGCCLCVLAMMLTSISSEYWHFILAHGVMFGIDSGSYFDKKQALALGVAASGSAIGGVVFPIIFNQLQPKIGFGWSIRVIGFIILLAATIPVPGMRVRTPPSAIRKIFDTKAWKEPPFLVTRFMGAYILPFYVQSYALDTNIVGGDVVVGSFFERMIPTHFADIYGPFNIDIICVLLSGILAFTWITHHTTASIILFTVSYGFFSGGLTSKSPNLGGALSPDTGVSGVRL
ncbi:uncharacterized protein EAE98_006369 [Botrytis deweyae]|uniref:Major facilitator superfamily (MFS) profile domain-containing protein n=1 Tax=Botrytis deweyae TaxID=2478750 RepID=A0ABQ7IKQ4_9HELO|nr:uncharacterized protein EAE98_006369 [Botrytis deweyae]KAF7926985.1 hypothetical protein EAE98_006369 [Botrytis deweyae]